MQWNIPFFLEHGLKQGRWNKTKRIGKKGTVEKIEKWKWRCLKNKTFQCDAPIRTADPLIWFILQHLCRCGGFELNKNGIIFDIVGTQYDKKSCRFVQRFGYFFCFHNFMNLRQSPNIPSVQYASITATCYDHSGMFIWLCPDSFILRTSEVFQHEKKTWLFVSTWQLERRFDNRNGLNQMKYDVFDKLRFVWFATCRVDIIIFIWMG